MVWAKSCISNRDWLSLNRKLVEFCLFSLRYWSEIFKFDVSPEFSWRFQKGPNCCTIRNFEIDGFIKSIFFYSFCGRNLLENLSHSFGKRTDLPIQRTTKSVFSLLKPDACGVRPYVRPLTPFCSASFKGIFLSLVLKKVWLVPVAQREVLRY